VVSEELIKCPMCSSKKVAKINELSVSDIEYIYRIRHGIEMRNFFVDHIFESESFILYRCKKCDLEFYSPMVLGDGEFYSQLQGGGEYYPEGKLEHSYVASVVNNISKGKTSVLEIGGGNGNLAELLDVDKYVALELNPNGLECIKKKGFQAYNMTVERFTESNPGDEFDAVIACQVLEHVENVHTFIESSIRLTKKGGLLIFSVPSRDTFMSDEINNVLNMPPHHQTLWGASVFSNMEDIYKLKIMNIVNHRLEPIHYMSYAKTMSGNLLGRGIRINKLLSKPFWSKLHGVISLPLYMYAKFFSGRISGHSITVVFMRQ